MDENKPPIGCPRCRMEQPLSHFRLLKESPLLYIDFCNSCCDKYGVKDLYRDENLRREVSEHARSIVLMDEDPASNRNEKKLLDRKEEQKRELARRELMRRRLIYYVTQNTPTYKAGWVHHDISRRLEKFMHDVEERKSPRLMLFMPPRHGKSQLASKDFPPWVLGHHPDWEIISASYAVSLPIGFSRYIRDQLKSAEYQAVFETRLRADSQGVEEWQTTASGRYRAAGVEVGITGTGAHILIIDDPIKDYQEAQSETVRDNAYNWYTSTARTRLAPGGGVLLIQTRWHDADLAGRLITDRQALIEAGVPLDEIDDWEVIVYPAIAEYDEYLFPDGTIQTSPNDIPEGARLLRPAGEALHPERYPTKELRKIRNTTPPVQWNALYQQNPVPDSGEYFTSDMFRTYQGLPGHAEEYTYFMAWDLAIGEKTQNDWSVGVVGALAANGNIYILDMLRDRMGTFQIVSSMLGMAKKYPGLQVLGVEDGQIKKTMWPLLQEAMRKESVEFSIDDNLKPVTDKLMRARPLQSKMQLGQVLLPQNQPWVSRMQHEMLRFPNGQHDDIVDAMAWLVRMSQRLSAPQPKGVMKKKKQKSWKDDLASFTNDRGNSFMTA